MIKFSAACFSVSLVALAAAIVPADAADMSGGAPGSIKDHGQAGVPVPVPVPYEEHFKYYFRGDLGIVVGANRPTLGESGMTYGSGDLYSPLVASNFASSSYGDLHGFPISVGAGFYVSPRFRADLTADFRRSQRADLSGSYAYTADVDAGLAATPPLATLTTFHGLPTGTIVSGSVADRMRTASTVFMANGYLDLTERGRFTPYIGGGLGFAYSRSSRDFAMADEYLVFPGPPAAPCSTPPTGCRAGASGSSVDTSVSLAAALMAGFSYSISPKTMFDLNYRLQYIQGYDLTTQIANVRQANGTLGTVESKMHVGDLWEHQLRAGVRVNLY